MPYGDNGLTVNFAQMDGTQSAHDIAIVFERDGQVAEEFAVADRFRLPRRRPEGGNNGNDRLVAAAGRTAARE